MIGYIFFGKGEEKKREREREGDDTNRINNQTMTMMIGRCTGIGLRKNGHPHNESTECSIHW
jgi:hypothetical protein